MRMSNSKLVTYKRWSPNYSSRYGNKITSIVIHHMAGCLTVQQCGAVFASRSRQASAHYGVRSTQIGQYVDEKYRAWTTGNQYIDRRSVTIEVSNSRYGGSWPVSDTSLQTTIKLCADICKRNSIKRLNYTGDKRGNLLMHRWYQQTACPGPYLAGKFKYIANEVNKLLGSEKGGGSKKKKKQKIQPAKKHKKKLSGTYTVTAKDGLFLRTGPGTKYSKLCLMPHNAKLKCYGYYTGAWYLVEYKGETGYANKKFLKKNH